MIEKERVIMKKNYTDNSIQNMPLVERLVSEYYSIEQADPSLSSEDDYGFNSTSNEGENKSQKQFEESLAKLKKIYFETFQFKPTQMENSRNISFFHQYYGRIPHLFQRYGGEAKIVENTPNGDPVELLKNDCLQYVRNLDQMIYQTMSDLLNTARRVASAQTVQQRTQIIAFYCKKYPIDPNNVEGMIGESIIRETIHRVAEAILGNHSIYGYTVDGIVYNRKFPPANHIVASIFLENPQEAPTEVPVNSVFGSPDSLLFFGQEQNIKQLTDMYKRICFSIVSNFNVAELKAVSHIVRQMAASEKSKLYNESKKDIDLSKVFRSSNGLFNRGDSNDKRMIMGTAKEIEKGLLKSIDIIIDQKKRIVQCSGIAFNMVTRVADTAKRAVAALEAVEDQYRDNRYVNTGAVSMNSRMENRFKLMNGANAASIGANAATAMGQVRGGSRYIPQQNDMY